MTVHDFALPGGFGEAIDGPCVPNEKTSACGNHALPLADQETGTIHTDAFRGPVMPHLVIEHSTEGHGGHLAIAPLMLALHRAAAETGVMQAADIKVRVAPYDHYLVAGKPDGFCHVSVYLLEGRSPEQKVAVSEALRAELSRLLPETRSLSVDIRDMDAHAYKKRLLAD